MTNEEDGGSFDYNEEDLKIGAEQEVEDEGLMPALEAIAQLYKMQDFSGTLGELYLYFAEHLQNTSDKMQAAELARTLQELSAYILSWQYADETYEKPFLIACKKLVDKQPAKKFEDLDEQKVSVFFQKALALEPELAATIQKRMKEEPESEMEE